MCQKLRLVKGSFRSRSKQCDCIPLCECIIQTRYTRRDIPDKIYQMRYIKKQQWLSEEELTGWSLKFQWKISDQNASMCSGVGWWESERHPVTNCNKPLLSSSLCLSLSGLVMLTHDRTNKNLGLLKVNCSSIHLCFPPPSLHPAVVKDKLNAI